MAQDLAFEARGFSSPQPQLGRAHRAQSAPLDHFGDEVLAPLRAFSFAGPQESAFAQLIEQIEPALRLLYPILTTSKKGGAHVQKALSPYINAGVRDIVGSIALLLLGGRFAMTIACYQAFKSSGARIMQKSLEELAERFAELRLAVERDPKARAVLDPDCTGTAALGPEEILHCLLAVSSAKTEEEQLLARQRVQLIMRCVDPVKLLDTYRGLWTGLMAVLATLRSRFVYAATLGFNVGRKLSDGALVLVKPSLEKSFPEKARLAAIIFRGASCGAGIVSGLMLVRVVCAFDSALRGASALLKSVSRTADEREWVVRPSAFAEDQKRVAIWTIALLGFAWQIKTGNKLPLMLKLPLAPLIILEWLLSILAAH